MPLHPFIKRIIARTYAGQYPYLYLKSVEEVRQYFFKQTHYTAHKTQYTDYPLSQGVVRVHQYAPCAQYRPLLIFFRGNGYSLGLIEGANLFCYYLSRYLNCIVAVIEPPLSPEVQFPIPWQACIEGVHYLIHHANDLKIDLKKVAIWGESSGGTLAASLSQHLVENKISLIRSQILFYPATDYSQDHMYPSKQEFSKGYLLDLALHKWFSYQYVRSAEDFNDYRVSPLLAENMQGMPETLLIGAQYDIVRDEGVAYLQKLKKNKVKIQTLFLPGLTHGFLVFSKRIKAARFAQWMAAKYLKYHIFF